MVVTAGEHEAIVVVVAITVVDRKDVINHHIRNRLFDHNLPVKIELNLTP